MELVTLLRALLMNTDWAIIIEVCANNHWRVQPILIIDLHGLCIALDPPLRG